MAHRSRAPDLARGPGAGTETRRSALVHLEETATAVYTDITEFQRTVDEIATTSPAAAAQLAPVNDAIHLVLLEITELGIKLYSSRTELPEVT